MEVCKISYACIFECKSYMKVKDMCTYKDNVLTLLEQTKCRQFKN